MALGAAGGMLLHQGRRGPGTPHRKGACLDADGAFKTLQRAHLRPCITTPSQATPWASRGLGASVSVSELSETYDFGRYFTQFPDCGRRQKRHIFFFLVSLWFKVEKSSTHPGFELPPPASPSNVLTATPSQLYLWMGSILLYL